MGASRWVRCGPGDVGKKLVEGLEGAYAAIKKDRDYDEAESESRRISSLSPADRMEERHRIEMLKLRRYMQPIEASWREFLEDRGWTPDDTAEMPDDWLYGEWMRYFLRRKYHITG